MSQSSLYSVIAASNRISTTSFNSRDAATLAAGATFQGVGEDVSSYARVGVAVVSDNATDGTLYMEVSHDGVTWGGPSRNWEDTRFAQPHMWNIVEKYFRIRYVNGTTEATNLALQVQYSVNSDIFLGHQLNETLLEETEAIVTRSVVVGKQPDGDYVNTPADGSALSTSSVLTAGSTYTSSWVDTDGWNTIEIFVAADVVSSYQGIVIEFTDDAQAGSPTVRGDKHYTFNSSDLVMGFKRIVVPPKLDGFRISYTNGAAGQSSFFLDATLKVNAGNETYNNGGAVLTASFETETALGNIDGYFVGAKFGRVKSIDAADAAVDIWAFADDAASPRADTKTFPSSASTFYLASSSASDTDVDVTVEYIDSTGEAQSVEINLNGQTGVSLGDTALDVNRMYVSGATAAVGSIYCCTADNFSSGTPATPSQCVAVAPAGYQQTQLSQFTVPIGKTLIIKDIYAVIARSNGSAGSAELSIRVKEYTGVSRIIREFFPTTSIPISTGNTNIVIPARAQIVWRLDDVSDGDTNCSVVWKYELIDD